MVQPRTQTIKLWMQFNVFLCACAYVVLTCVHACVDITLYVQCVNVHQSHDISLIFIVFQTGVRWQTHINLLPTAPVSVIKPNKTHFYANNTSRWPTSFGKDNDRYRPHPPDDSLFVITFHAWTYIRPDSWGWHHIEENVSSTDQWRHRENNHNDSSIDICLLCAVRTSQCVYW